MFSMIVRIIAVAILIIPSSWAYAITDDQVRNLMIKESINSYPGNCPCPFNSTANGRSCGGRSAYSRPGGYSPLCYKGDISADEVAAWRNRNNMPPDSPKQKVIRSEKTNNAILSPGGFSQLYDRAGWKHWIDADGDCQNTRTEVLIGESSDDISFDSVWKCSVKSGSWVDRYSGNRYNDPSLLDIDHIVPLKWANGHGGDKWRMEKKTEFANDLKNLHAVSASLNRQKGDKGPDEWMPPNHTYRCQYLNEFLDVVNRYKLEFTPSENRVISKMLTACK